MSNTSTINHLWLNLMMYEDIRKEPARWRSLLCLGPLLNQPHTGFTQVREKSGKISFPQGQGSQGILKFGQ